MSKATTKENINNGGNNKKTMKCEWKVKAAIAELNDCLKGREGTLWALKNLKRATKKDGKPFVRLSDNYPEAKVRIEYDIYGKISGIELYGGFGKPDSYGRNYHTITMYLKEHQDAVSFEEVEGLIAAEIARLETVCESYRKQIKAARKAFAKIDNLTMKLIEGIDSIEEAKEKPYGYTSLGYALMKYAKYILL